MIPLSISFARATEQILRRDAELGGDRGPAHRCVAERGHRTHDLLLGRRALLPPRAAHRVEILVDGVLGREHVVGGQHATAVGMAARGPGGVADQLQQVRVPLGLRDRLLERVVGPAHPERAGGGGEGQQRRVVGEPVELAVGEPLAEGDHRGDRVRRVGQPGGEHRGRDVLPLALQVLPGIGERAQAVAVGLLDLVDEQHQAGVLLLRAGRDRVAHDVLELPHAVDPVAVGGPLGLQPRTRDADADREPLEPFGELAPGLAAPVAGGPLELVGDGSDQALGLARGDPHGQHAPRLGAPLHLAQQRGLAEPARGDVDPDPPDQPLQVDQVGQPLVGLGELLGAAGDLAGDLAGCVRTRLHASPDIARYRTA